MRTWPIVITPSARADVDAILAYILQESTQGAQVVAMRFLESITSLANFPERFPISPEAHVWKYGVRCMGVYHYRVLYVVQDSRVVIVRVVHGAMESPVDAPVGLDLDQT